MKCKVNVLFVEVVKERVLIDNVGKEYSVYDLKKIRSLDGMYLKERKDSIIVLDVEGVKEINRVVGDKELLNHIHKSKVDGGHYTIRIKGKVLSAGNHEIILNGFSDSKKVYIEGVERC